MTKDHSLLRELIDKGRIDEAHTENFAYKNIITKAIGTEYNVDPSVRTCEVLDHDIYLMCTDGLSDVDPTEQIETILNKKQSIKDAVRELIETAKNQGSQDNITVVIAKVQQVHEK